MKEISRRNFMKGGASAVTLAMLSQTGMPAFAVGEYTAFNMHHKHQFD